MWGWSFPASNPASSRASWTHPPTRSGNRVPPCPGQGPESRHQFFGHRTGKARTDRPPVEGNDRHYFRGRARHEGFLRGVNVVTGDGLFRGDQTGLGGQFEDRFAGHALQRALPSGRGQQAPLAQDKQVVGGAFRDVTVLGQQNGLQGAALTGLNLRQNVVEVVQALDLGAEGFRHVAAGGHRDQGQAVAIRGVRVETDEVGDDDVGGLAAQGGTKAQIALPPREQGAYISVFKAVGGQGPEDFRPHGGLSQGRLQQNSFGRIVKAVQVLGQTEDFAVVSADSCLLYTSD